MDVSFPTFVFSAPWRKERFDDLCRFREGETGEKKDKRDNEMKKNEIHARFSCARTSCAETAEQSSACACVRCDLNLTLPSM